MNAAAAQALFEAERKGVRQLRNKYRDSKGGMCAMEVLILQARKAGDVTVSTYFDLGRGKVMPCPDCGDQPVSERGLIIHLNDEHDRTFSEIARKLGPDSA